MINFILGPNIFLSCILGVAVILLYGLRTVRPELAREEDIFFVTTGLFYCGILTVHGWRLDPILLFSQALIITAMLFAGWENIRLRGIVDNYKQRKRKKKNDILG